jgi:hypothetical protein
MQDREIQFDCPTCGDTVTYVPGNRGEWFPFCSERCKLVDLGKWFEEEHRIEEPLDPTAGQPRPRDRSDDNED